MSSPVEQVSYSARDPAFPVLSQMPVLTFSLIGRTRITVEGLVDTGASINVLPRSIGDALGFDWAQETNVLPLGGALSGIEARAVLIPAAIGKFPPVRLVFGWAIVDAVPMLLGQMNFFMEFDVCFFRSRGFFEVRPKS